MLPLPFVVLRNAPTVSIVLAGLMREGTLHEHLGGFDPVRIELVEFDPVHIEAVVSIDPASVYFGVQTQWDTANALDDILGEDERAHEAHQPAHGPGHEGEAGSSQLAGHEPRGAEDSRAHHDADHHGEAVQRAERAAQPRRGLSHSSASRARARSLTTRVATA